jgi:hypothetical protein
VSRKHSPLLIQNKGEFHNYGELILLLNNKEGTLMKKRVIVGVIALMLSFSFSLGVLAAPKLTLWFNNKAQKTDVRMINNKPYVPLSEVATFFGGNVTYDKKANTYKVTSKDFDPNPPKSFNVNVVQTSGPIKLTISKVTLNPAYKKEKYIDPIKSVILDVKIENTSTEKLNFHPTQALALFNTGEQVESLDTFMYSDLSLSGSYLGKAIKTGKIALLVKSSKFEAINSIQLNIAPPIDANYDDLGEELLFDVKFR